MFNILIFKIMKQLLSLGILFAAITMTISCEKEELIDPRIVTGTGEIVTKPLSLSTFSRIEFNGLANLYVTVGGEQSLILKAQQNIIEILNWEVDAGILTIWMDEGVTIQNHEEIRFEIVVNELFSLLHDGVGDMALQGGNQESLTIDFRGVGNIHAYALPVDNCIVMSTGVGNCEILVNNYLEVDISGAGNVYYRGEPEIISTGTGLGDLINEN
jgi:hypothetical protein